MASRERKRQLVEGSAESLEEQRSAGRVAAQQAHAALAVREAEDRDLVARGVPGAGDQQLQDGAGAVAEGRLGDECLRSAAVHAPHGDGPRALELRNERGEPSQPRGRAVGERLPADDLGNALNRHPA